MGDDTIRKACGKCGGQGVLNAFRHIAGGRCYSCKGVGYFETTKRREANRLRRAEAKRQAEADRAAPLIEAADARMEAAATDPRVGPETRARMAKHPVVAFEVSTSLAKWDADADWIEARPWIRRNLAE